MKTLTMEVEIAIDGRLHLDIFSGLPPGQAEVVLVIQPSTQRKFQQGIQQSVTQQTNSDLQHLAEITSASAYDVDSIANLSEKEKMDRLGELLRFALQGVEWSEIKEGRRDDANRY